MFIRQSRVSTTAGAFAVSAVVAGTSIFGGSAAIAAAPASLVTQVQQDITLTAVPTFAQSLLYLLDDMLQIGNKTLGDLFDPDNDTTLEYLFGISSLSISSDMSTVFNALGLDDVSFGSLLGPLVPTDTLGELLGAGGAMEALGAQTLNDLFGSFGGVNQSLADLIHSIGLGTTTVGELLQDLGISSGATMDDLLDAVGLIRLDGLLPLMGLTATTDALVGIAKLTGSAITGTTTLDSLFGTGGLLNSIGGLSLAQMLGISNGETLVEAINGLKWGTGTLGDQTLADVLGWLNLDPSQSLAENLSGLPISLDGSADLGTASLGSFLTSLMNPADVTGTADPVVTTSTTLADYLDSLFGAGMTLDDFLGLGDVTPWVP